MGKLNIGPGDHQRDKRGQTEQSNQHNQYGHPFGDSPLDHPVHRFCTNNRNEQREQARYQQSRRGFHTAHH